MWLMVDDILMEKPINNLVYSIILNKRISPFRKILFSFCKSFIMYYPIKNQILKTICLILCSQFIIIECDHTTTKRMARVIRLSFFNSF